MASPGQFLEQAAISGYDQAHVRKQQRKDMLSDEERQIKAKDLIDTRNSILTKLPNLLGPNGEKTPEYDQAYQSLAQAQQGLGELYHPQNSPGALHKDWHFLLEKMHGIASPKDKVPSSVTAQTPEMTLNASATPITPTGLSGEPMATVPGMTAPTAPPLTITQSFEGKPAPGMVAQGNLDLSKRPNIDNGDGTHSSTFSMSFGTDNGEVLVPGVGDGKTYPVRQLRVLYTLPDGTQRWAVPGNQPHNWIAPERPTPQNNEALDQYQKTGKHFGIFEDEKAADAYGKTLHEDQEKYGHNGVTAHPVSPSGNVMLPAGPPVTVTKTPAPSWGQAQVLKQRAAAMQRAQQEASLLVAGAPLSPQQQAMAQQRTNDIVHRAQIESSLKMASELGITGPALEEFKQQLVGIKNITPKPLTGEAGKPYKGEDGLWYQSVVNPDGSIGRRPMNPDWKPNTKAVSGTIINTKQHGWIKTWVDPYNPNKVIGFQKITPGRQYTGTTSSSSSTDPFGLTTSSSRSTMPTTSAPVDVDFSGVQELPSSYSGGDVPSSPAPSGQSPATPSSPSGSPKRGQTPTAAPPRSVASPATTPTPAQLRGQVPAPPQTSGRALPLDETGHIPTNAPYNKQLIGAANDLLDGKDLDKLPIPLKAKEAAENLARAYGWGGQGMFSPQQKLQIREASSFLNDAINSDALSVLDSRISREKIISALNNSEGHAGWTDALIARNFNLNPKEAEFLRMYRQLTGTISGLASLTRPGRPTEAGIKRLMFELPNPNESHSAADAKERLKRLIKEIDIARQTGSADTLFGTPSSANNPSGGMSLEEFKKKHGIGN